MQNKFPKQFVENIKTMLTDKQAELFFEAITREPVVSLRKNPYKNTKSSLSDDKIQWCEEGVYLKNRVSFTLDPLFHAGGYYVQEASSMFIEQFFRQAILPAFERDITVIDLCAAPGGKTTHIASLIGRDSLVIANETIASRSKILEQNIIKWGTGNVIVTSSDPSSFSHLASVADVLLIDAPCSGEGMFRRLDEAVNEWSESNVELCASRQQRIIADSYESLKEGGFLIYSTCTFNSRENEDNVRWIFENFDVEPVDIDIKEEWGVTKVMVDGVNCFRFFPHLCRGEGFFAAIFRRKGEPSSSRVKKRKGYKSRYRPLTAKEKAEVCKWVKDDENLFFMADEASVVYGFNAEYKECFEDIEQYLKIVYPALCLGQLFRNDFKPLHPMALYVELNENAPVVRKDITKDDALDYLRKKDIDPLQFEQGVNLIFFEGLPIGFIKRIGNRLNNLYPKEYRIMNL